MWTLVFEVGLKIVSMVLDKVGANKAAKEKFFEFVKLAANDTSSAKLMKWGDEQLKEIESAKWD